VPSPKVATYDLKPEMSRRNYGHGRECHRKNEFDAIIMNYANADMVGHSGKLEAAIKAVELWIGPGADFQTLKPRGQARGSSPRIHGKRRNDDRSGHGGPHTYHTTNACSIDIGD